MNELIERLAREAGFGTYESGCIKSSVMPGTDISEDLARFAALVAEECAKVCELTADNADRIGGPRFGSSTLEAVVRRDCASIIREAFKPR